MKGVRSLSERGLRCSSAILLPVNTVLLTTRAPIGYVAIAKNKLATNQGFRNLVLRQGNSHEFLYYSICNKTDELKRLASGSTFGELSGTALKKILLSIPPYNEQKNISYFLSTLDDKIELNRCMNQTLEEIAQTLFKSWFVNFDPVRANLDDGNTGLPKHIADLFPNSFDD